MRSLLSCSLIVLPNTLLEASIATLTISLWISSWECSISRRISSFANCFSFSICLWALSIIIWAWFEASSLALSMIEIASLRDSLILDSAAWSLFLASVSNLEADSNFSFSYALRSFKIFLTGL